MLTADCLHICVQLLFSAIPHNKFALIYKPVATFNCGPSFMVAYVATCGAAMLADLRHLLAHGGHILWPCLLVVTQVM